MDSERTRQMAAALLRDGDAGVAVVADGVVRAWMLIDRELSPIVGTAGVAALYRRSLHVCLPGRPVLAAALGTAQRTIDAEPLRAVLLVQEAREAATLGAELLHTFHEILSHMVGPSLTERLLRPVWNDLSGDAPTEGTLS